ncbi:carboxypeptidase-like regulatory domain-containing protein [Streptomyces misionensis]|uniref:carboxypeptidase-like regulatory domain-containing protein n=1 Tax=Streptomyces misionensis TaxID=67331 RepID=UPI003410DB5B
MRTGRTGWCWTVLRRWRRWNCWADGLQGPGSGRAPRPGPGLRGRPVPRALVTVLGPGGRRLVSTLTDARGEYAVTGLPEGYLSVVAAVPGRQPAVRQTLLGSGEVVRADFLLRDRPGAVPAGGPARD